MKKKKIEFSHSTRCMLYSLLVASIFIIFCLFFLNLKPQFTIYKEECTNESYCIYQSTDNSNLIFLKNGCKEGCITLSTLLNNTSQTQKCLDSCNNYQNIPVHICSIEYKCNKVEVDEIEYCEPEFIAKGYNSSCGAYGYIKKSDLTKEWLDENCEILEWKDFYSIVFITNQDFTECPECVIKKDSAYYTTLNSNPKYVKKSFYQCIDNNKYNKWTGKKGLGYECDKPIKYKCFENYFVEVK